MDNKYYAVIDTNVIVSAMLSSNPASNPAKVFHAVLNGRVLPLYNDEILDEYQKVLSRPKFPFKQTDISAIIQLFRKLGIDSDRVTADELFPDPKDIVFYEVALSHEDAYLVTGNLKHFPKQSRVVSPSEMVALLET